MSGGLCAFISFSECVHVCIYECICVCLGVTVSVQVCICGSDCVGQADPHGLRPASQAGSGLGRGAVQPCVWGVQAVALQPWLSWLNSRLHLNSVFF